MPVPPAHPLLWAETTRGGNGTAPALCVLVVDVHQMVSAVLARALRRAGLDAHELAVGDHDMIVAAAACYPDGVVLLEPALGADAGGRRIGAVGLIAALTRQGKRVLVLSENLDRTGSAIDVGAAIAAGAIAAVPKSASLDSLLHVLTAAATGRPLMTSAEHAHWLTCHHQHQQHAQERARRLGLLTPREHEVLALMGAGHRAVAIAEHYVVALATVRTQIHSVLAKLEVGSQLEAVALLFDTSPSPGGRGW